MKTIASILFVLVAAPAAANQSFALPEGCEGYVTIQKRGCVVTHLFTCAGDPPGQQRRADLGEDGLDYLGIIDAEAQWVESFHVTAGHTDTLGPRIRDAASFTELLETGADDFDFETTSDLYGVTRYVGRDGLTGVVVEIDGVPLRETDFELTAFDAAGAELFRVSGREYIHPDWRTFVSGVRRVTSANGVTETDNTPVDFAFPGEPGFLARDPVQDCSVVLSLAEIGQ
ncbi:MAG: hypothetical protein HLUCCA08_02735 [Rhodobacteraceae bacterium HLUCCA08]|nr:MAG: hypothetical protein HLUCCA08_02735 [Rhodobacteraceae bacterium HLUCCA08]